MSFAAKNVSRLAALGLALGACSPVVTGTARVKLVPDRSKTVGGLQSGLEEVAAGDGTLPQGGLGLPATGYCFAVHAYGPGLFDSQEKPQQACATGPAGLGKVFGASAYGKTRNIEVAAGPDRSFDIVGFKLADLGLPAAHDCTGTLSAQYRSGLPPKVTYTYKGVNYSLTEKSDGTSPLRFMARGKSDLVVGVNEVSIHPYIGLADGIMQPYSCGLAADSLRPSWSLVGNFPAYIETGSTITYSVESLAYSPDPNVTTFRYQYALSSSSSLSGLSWTNFTPPSLNISVGSLANGSKRYVHFRVLDDKGRSSIPEFVYFFVDKGSLSTPILSSSLSVQLGDGDTSFEVAGLCTNSAVLPVSVIVDINGYPQAAPCVAGTFSLAATALPSGIYPLSVYLVTLSGRQSMAQAYNLSVVNNCPVNYVRITGTSVGDFCVAKFEMKASFTNPAAEMPLLTNLDGRMFNLTDYPASVPEGTPWVGLNYHDAFRACERLNADGSEQDGFGHYQLMNNTQWNEVAKILEQQTSNWDTGTSGSGYLFRGHSDDLTLTTQVFDDELAFAGSKALAAASIYVAFSEDGYVGTDNSAGDSLGLGFEQRRNLYTGTDYIWDFAGNVGEFVRFDYDDGHCTDGTMSCFDSGLDGTAQSYILPVMGTGAISGYFDHDSTNWTLESGYGNYINRDWFYTPFFSGLVPSSDYGYGQVYSATPRAARSWCAAGTGVLDRAREFMPSTSRSTA